MAGRRQVDDREPAEAERDAGFGVDPVARVVRPAMDERVAHPPHLSDQLIRLCRLSRDEPRQSTHAGGV